MSKRIGEYEVTKELLGKGEFGKVHLGYHWKSREKVAIKVVRLDKQKPGDDPTREVQELNRITKIGHPNIIKLYDQQKSDKLLLMVLEYCDGGDLKQALALHGALPEPTAKRLFREIASGLCFLNEQRIMHRDLKPANIFLTSQNINETSIRIADLGFAKTVMSSSLMEHSLIGTPVFMAPERLGRRPNYTFQSEVWAAGLILYEMVFGASLIVGVNDFDDLARVHNRIESLVFPSAPAVSQELKLFIRSMLRLNPNERIRIHEVLSHECLQHTQTAVAQSAATEAKVEGEPSADGAAVAVDSRTEALPVRPRGASAATYVDPALDPSRFSVNPMIAPPPPIVTLLERRVSSDNVAQASLPPLAPSANTSTAAAHHQRTGGAAERSPSPQAPLVGATTAAVIGASSPSHSNSTGGGGSQQQPLPVSQIPMHSRSPRLGPSPPPQDALMNTSMTSSVSNSVPSVVFHRVSVAAEHVKAVIAVAMEEVLNPARAINLMCYASTIAARSNDQECKYLRNHALQLAVKQRALLPPNSLNTTTNSPVELLFAKACWLARRRATELLLFSGADAAVQMTPQHEAAWGLAAETYSRASLIFEILLEDPSLSERDRNTINKCRTRMTVLTLNGRQLGVMRD